MKAQRQTEISRRQPLGTPFLRGVVLLVFSASILAVLPMPCVGQEGPKPDPAGIATGDKTTAVDGGGNAFVVAEPTLSCVTGRRCGASANSSRRMAT